MKEEQVILVNEKDEPIGLMNKLEAHEKAVLHRAFSVFILNKNNELMLQQRAHHKYHSPLLWTNTCCSHQRDGETNIEAGTRRLFEEMDEEPKINPEEVESWKWMKIEDVKEDMIQNPDIYTIWFKIIFDKFYHYIEDHKI